MRRNGFQIDDMLFHQRLSSLFECKGFNPRKVSDALKEAGVEVSDSTVRRWITGEAEPSFIEAVYVAEMFDVPLDELAVADDIGARPPRSAAAMSRDDDFVLRTYRAQRIDADEAHRRLSRPIDQPQIRPPSPEPARKDRAV